MNVFAWACPTLSCILAVLNLRASLYMLNKASCGKVCIIQTSQPDSFIHFPSAYSIQFKVSKFYLYSSFNNGQCFAELHCSLLET